MTPSCDVTDDPELNPPASGGDRKSNDTSTELAPAGTSTWITYISEGLRRQARSRPPAVILRSTKSASGPVGECSPGIHLGYASRSGPGAAGIVIRAWTTRRVISEASTFN